MIDTESTVRSALVTFFPMLIAVLSLVTPIFDGYLRDDPKRERYTELSRALEKIVADAPRTPAAQREKPFEPADRLFAEMNDDCVRSAKASP